VTPDAVQAVDRSRLLCSRSAQRADGGDFLGRWYWLLSWDRTRPEASRGHRESRRRWPDSFEIDRYTCRLRGLQPLLHGVDGRFVAPDLS
jgi:hypothetical protein